MNTYEKKIVEGDYREITVTTMAEFVACISAINKYFIQVLYRGQACSEWPVVSGAYRKLEGTLKGKNAREELLKYHTSLINDSRHLYDGKLRDVEVNDLYLLAYAQHHEAKTNLIDFSKNPLIALWMACQETDCTACKKEGCRNKKDRRIKAKPARVFWINKDLELVNKDSKIEALSKDDGLKLYKFEPPFIDRRVVVQQGVFLVAPNGEIREEDYNTISIPSKSKKHIIEELAGLGISQKTVYPDFEGFTQWFDYTGKDRIYALLDEAKTLYEKKDYESARSCYMEALDCATNLWGEDDVRNVIIYKKIGMVLADLNIYSEAICYTEKALDICIDVFGEDHPETADSYQRMGIRYREADCFSKAIECYEKALKTLEKIPKANCRAIAIVYNNLGECYRYLGDFDKAIEIHEMVLAARKNMFAKSGNSHRSIAITFANLSRCHAERGDTALFDDSIAKKYAYDSLDIRRERFVPANVYVANSLTRCAEYENKFGDSQKAIDLLNEALTVRPNNSKGEEARRAIGMIYLAFGIAYCNLEDTDKATEQLEEALKIYCKIFDDGHSETARVYEAKGELCLKMSQNAEALSWLEKAHDIYQNVLGDTSARTVRALARIEEVKKA